MAGKDLNQELNELIRSCQNQGILGDYFFDQVKWLQDEQNPKFVTELITLFFAEVDNAIADLTTILSEPEVNYPGVRELADTVKQNNLSMGGSRVDNACRELCGASEAKNRATCLESFEVLNREYLTLKENLNNIVQMERTIYDNKV